MKKKITLAILMLASVQASFAQNMAKRIVDFDENGKPIMFEGRPIGVPDQSAFAYPKDLKCVPIQATNNQKKETQILIWMSLAVPKSATNVLEAWRFAQANSNGIPVKIVHEVSNQSRVPYARAVLALSKSTCMNEDGLKSLYISAMQKSGFNEEFVSKKLTEISPKCAESWAAAWNEAGTESQAYQLYWATKSYGVKNSPSLTFNDRCTMSWPEDASLNDFKKGFLLNIKR